MLPLTSSLSYRDPSREVVLRVEAIVEKEARVSTQSGWASGTSWALVSPSLFGDKCRITLVPIQSIAAWELVHHSLLRRRWW